MTTDSLDEFRSSGNSLAHWKITAESLVSAAEALRGHAGERREAPWGTLWPELMLWAFAMETFFKTLRLKHAIDSLDPEKLLYRDDTLQAPKSHDLVELAEWVGFPLDSFRREVLEQLTKAARYEGRYPVPLHGELVSSWWYGQSSDEEVDSIIADLLERLPNDPAPYQKEKLEEAEGRHQDP